jgi:SAM-dependent methyltransferase
MLPLLNQVPGGSSVLDIGCGSGLFLLLLVANDKVTYAVGCDSNLKALNSAKQAISQLLPKKINTKISFIRAEVPDDWPNEEFSIVSMIDVMHHVPPPLQQSFFEAATRRLKSGGYLIYKDMCKYPYWKATANRIHDLIIARQLIHYVPIQTIKKWGEFCGLTLEKEVSYSKYFYGHEQILFKKR